MECKYNKHLFLLNEKQKMIHKYFALNLNKPKCPNCNKSTNVIQVITSTQSRSIKRISALTRDVLCNQRDCPKNKFWKCKRCDAYI